MASWPNRAPEQMENKQSWVDLISESQELFVNESLERDITFFDSILSSSVSWSYQLFDEFKKFLNKKSKYKQLALSVSWYKPEQKDILEDQLKKEINKFLFVRKKNVKDLVNIYKKEYKSINSRDLRKKLSSAPIVTLSSLMKSEAKRRAFLKDNNIFSDEQELLENKRLNEDNLLKNIKISKKSLKKLNNEQKNRLYRFFDSNSKMDFPVLEDIFNSLNDEESKINLLKYFVSSVSVADLEKVKLLKPSFKKIIIDSIKDELWVSESEAKDIYSDLPKTEIFLSVDDLDLANLRAFLDDNSFKQKIIDEYNSELKEADLVEDPIANLSLDAKWNIHNSFLDLVKSDKNISQNIKENISLLQNWNILEIEQWWRKWYYYIKKIDNWSNLSSKNIVLENITAEWWARKVWAWYEVSYTYPQILKLLQKASNPENKVWFKLLSLEDFKKSWVSERIESASEIENYDDLVKWLDDIDPEWASLWFDTNKTVILSSENNFVFLIKNIDKSGKTITIDQWWSGLLKLSFWEFFNVMKSSWGKYKRWKKINTFSEMISSLWNSALSWLKLTSSWLIDQTKDKKKKFPVKFLVWWEKAIYIKNISENSVNYSIWKIETKDKKRNFKAEFKSSNLTQFFEDIKTNSMLPEFDEKLDEEEQKKKSQKMKWSFFKRFMSGLSISEILDSFNFIVDWVKKKLERWNRLKSLRFAQKFKWMLWTEMWITLQSMAEKEEKNLSEEIMWQLKDLSSDKMIEQIKAIIFNKDSEQYEIIACLMTVASKNGVLYPKWLSEYAWSLHWYKILWWTKAFEMKYRKDLASGENSKWEKEPLNFTEEWLVEAWLKELTKQWKVRSRLDKDFWWAIASWRSAELEDWKSKVWDQITYDWKINYFIWELKSRTYWNALWWIEKIFSKNSSSQDMQAVWFILAMSWYWANLDQVLVKHIQTLAFTTPYLSLMYWYSADWHKKYKKFMEALLKRVLPNDSKALSELKSITSSKNPPAKAYEFWKKYWDKLIKYLNFKDPMIALESHKIPEFKEFYEKAKWVWWDSEYNPKLEDLEIWVYQKNSVWLWWALLWKQFSWNPTWWFSQDGQKIFDMYIDTLNSIKSWTWTLEEKRTLFKNTYKPFERALVLQVFWRFIIDTDEATSPIYSQVRKAWLDLVKTQSPGSDYDAQIDAIFNRFMNTTTVTTSSTTNQTKTSIDNILAN